VSARRYWVQFLALSALWGASYLFIKIGLRDMSAAEIVSGRTALAALILLPVALHRGAFRGLGGRAPEVVALAVVQVVAPFTLITFGERHIASSLTGILVAAVPLFTVVFAPILDPEERSFGWRLVGVLVGIVGVGLLLGVDLHGDSQALLGGVMVVMACAGYALGGLWLKRRFRDVQPVGLVTGTMVATSLVMLPAAVATAPSSAPGLGPLAAVAALGIGGTGIAFVLYYTLIGARGPARSSLVAYVAPAFALFYGVIFLNEGVTVGTFAGLVLILGGSWLAAGGTLGRRSRGELAAGGVDVAAAREADRRPDPVFLEGCAESVDRATG
jgi:drug/metabolite transporter (DMT)-like permease